MNYRIQGNTKQETRSGKNLFNIDAFLELTGNTAYYQKDDGGNLVMVSQDLRQNGSFPICVTLPAGTYTISPYDVTVQRLYNNTTGTVYASATFTLTDTCQLSWKCWAAAGTVVGKIQIEAGSAATEYEPYGAMPSPAFPSAVQTVGDLAETGEQAGKYSVPITVSGKNLLYSTMTASTSNGVTLTYDNGKITLNGSCTASYNFRLGDIVLGAGTYTLSANANKVPVLNNRNLIELYDAETNQRIYVTNSNAQSSHTATTSSDGTFLYRIRIEAGTTYDNFVLQPQLEAGTTATSYEPYAADTADIYTARPLIGVKNLAGEYMNPDYLDAKAGQAVYRNTEFVVDGSYYGGASIKFAYVFPQTASGTDEKTGTALALAKVNPNYASAVYQSVPGVLNTKDDGTYYESNAVGIASNIFHTDERSQPVKRAVWRLRRFAGQLCRMHFVYSAF